MATITIAQFVATAPSQRASGKITISLRASNARRESSSQRVAVRFSNCYSTRGYLFCFSLKHEVAGRFDLHDSDLFCFSLEHLIIILLIIKFSFGVTESRATEVSVVNKCH
jgi:hypothetical protein